MCCLSAGECVFCFFLKQKTAYEMRISDWSSDVCSSDLIIPVLDSWGVVSIAGRLWDLKAVFPRAVDAWSGVSHLALVTRDVVQVVGSSIRRLRVEQGFRSEERRVGKEGVSTCRSRGSPYH